MEPVRKRRKSGNINDEEKSEFVRVLLYGSPNANNHEVITRLLHTEPNPLIQHEEYSVYEWALNSEAPISVQELYLHSTYNYNQNNKMHLNILVRFVRDVDDTVSRATNTFMPRPQSRNSPSYQIWRRFDRERRYRRLNDFYESMAEIFKQHYLLFTMDIDYLRSLLQGCHSDIHDLCNIVFDGNHICYFSYDDKLSHDQVITYLESFLESGPKMNDLVMKLISELDWRLIFDAVKKNGEEATTELLLFLIRNGLRLETPIYDAVRKEFGYCELFRILLHMDVGKTKTFSSETGVMTSLILDVRADLEDYLDKDYFVPGMGEVLDYFAHPKLTKYLQKYSDILPEKYREKFEEHPRVPNLVEIARNALRKYLVECFEINTRKQFYNLVNDLPITTLHKEIISYGAKLY